MSPTTDNFIHSLVEMSKAFEELPAVRTQYEQANARWLEGQDHIQRLELKLRDRAAEIEALQAKVRSTEVERDDAELRFLELDDKAHNAIAMAKAAQVSLAQLDGLLNPPKPEPEPLPSPPAEPEVKHEETFSQTSGGLAMEPTNQQVADAQGQSEPDPTSSASEKVVPQSGVGHSANQSESVGSSSTASVEVPKSDANPSIVAISQVPVEPSAESTAIQSENVTSFGTTQLDNVGYSNEPDVRTDWQAWDAWCTQMNQRYGNGNWPARP